jgi:hypothetical protein
MGTQAQLPREMTMFEGSIPLVATKIRAFAGTWNTPQEFLALGAGIRDVSERCDGDRGDLAPSR